MRFHPPQEFCLAICLAKIMFDIDSALVTMPLTMLLWRTVIWIEKYWKPTLYKMFIYYLCRNLTSHLLAPGFKKSWREIEKFFKKTTYLFKCISLSMAQFSLELWRLSLNFWKQMFRKQTGGNSALLIR